MSKLYTKKVSMNGDTRTVRYQVMGVTMVKKRRGPKDRQIKVCGIPVYKRKKKIVQCEEEVQCMLGIPLLKKRILPGKSKRYVFGIRVSKKSRNEVASAPASPSYNGPGIKFPAATVLAGKRVLIIAELSLPQCTTYRVEAKRDALEQHGYSVEICSWHDEQACMQGLQLACYVIFYRVPYVEKVQRYYEEAARLGLHRTFDVDDLIFDLDIYSRELHENYEFEQSFIDKLLNGARLYRESLLNADDVWVSTEVLRDVAATTRKEAHIIENPIVRAVGIGAQCCRQKDRKVKIFYGSGSNTHDSDFRLVYPALTRILEEYPDVDVYVHGELNIDYISPDLQSRFIKVDRVKAEDYYFAISQYDIALMPLVKTTFTEAKSNIKYIEASCLKIPSVASDLREFSNVITHGVDGFIAATSEEWYDSLKTLVEDEALRKRMGEKAYANVQTRYALQENGRKMVALIEARQPAAKQRIMVVNVLYGVSSFGGATVVAEALAEKIQQLSTYETIVFSAHFDAAAPIGSLWRYDWNGVHVISVNLGGGVNMTYWDEGIGDIFARVLQEVNPAIVHFHCIQTLGMKLVHACIEASIPYAITVHDGWWRCARQFLVDEKGEYCGDCQMCASMCKERCHVSAAEYFRKLHMADHCFANAALVYTPSYYFSDFVQKDFPGLEVRTNKNGILDSMFANKEKSRSSRIRFGFFGGRELVKGYFFMKKVMQSYNPSDYELVLIDTASRGESGPISNDGWGDNVTILGYTEHEKMADVYRSIDVLLFPSFCKESFGLMVREAVANDVFVISSECGGPAEAIVPGKNGLVFPMGDVEKFKACIDYVFAHAEELKMYKTTEFGDVRTFDEQSKELITDFNDTINK